MDIHRANLGLQWAAIAFAVGSLLSLVLAIWWPYAASAIENKTVAITVANPDRSEQWSLPPLKSFEPVWNLELRRPLFDGTAVMGASRPPFAAKLAGTIIEQGRSQAMFTVPTPGGGGPTIEFKGVGEKVAGAEVTAIDESSATVLYFGEPLVLRVEDGSPN